MGQSEDQAGSRNFTAGEAMCVAALALLAAIVLWWRWVGYQGHDDGFYAGAALNWLHHFPPLGTTHWALRYTLVLPLAAAIGVLGPTTFALGVPNLAAYALFLAVNYAAVRHWFGRRAAVLITLMAIVLPAFVVQATYANPDLLETAFATASFWTLMLARERGGNRALMLLCGVLAGLGFLTRETSLLLAVLYGLLFLFRPAAPRWRYVLIGAGFAAVVGAQAGYFAVRTGDPFYRARISATHDKVDRGAKQAAAEAAGAALDSEGVLATNPVVAPLAAIFISQKFGLLFLLAIPSYVLLRRSKLPVPRAADVIDCAALGSLVAFLFVALNAEILYIVPRYFMVSAALAMVPVAILAARLLRGTSTDRWTAVTLVAAFAVSSVGLLYLENVQPMWAEQQLADFVAKNDRIVHADPVTLFRVRYLLLAPGVLDRVSPEPPGPDSFVIAEAGAVPACLAAPGCSMRARMAPFAPQPGWTEVARFTPPRRGIAMLVEAVGLDRILPADIVHKIDRPGVEAVVYATP